MSASRQLVALDLETTGLHDDARPIQLGLAVASEVSLGLDVGWKAGTYTVQAEALAINGFTLERIEAGEQAHVVAVEACKWLDAHDLTSNLIPVGWNVGSFDVPLVKRWLPQLAARFGHRALDLNSVCFVLGQAGKRSAEEWKDAAKQYVSKCLRSECWHDAEFDARASLEALFFLRAYIKRGVWG